MPNDADVIVLGLGAMGAAAAYHLARRGRWVIGFDAHPRGHAHGSSHGESRIIRQAYHEGTAYMLLIRRAYANWRELEAEAERPLVHLNGGLIIGRSEGRTVRGTIASAQQFGLPYEELSPAEVAARFPGFRLDESLVAVLEPNAGFLAAADCLAAHLDLAARHGADCRHGEPVRDWAVDGAGVRVETDRAIYRADRLVVAAGPWSPTILAALGLPLTVLRVINAFFQPPRPDRYDVRDCPIVSLLVPEGHYYGIPGSPATGFKIGRHDSDERCTPETARRRVDDDEIAMLRRVVERYLPGAAGPLRSSVTCLYTMTPDKRFIVDRHPGHPQVAVACGFSGHGFKFSSVIGEILADLTIAGSTRHPIGFLSTRRFPTEAA